MLLCHFADDIYWSAYHASCHNPPTDRHYLATHPFREGVSRRTRRAAVSLTTNIQSAPGCGNVAGLAPTVDGPRSDSWLQTYMRNVVTVTGIIGSKSAGPRTMRTSANSGCASRARCARMRA